ncbi:MAG: MATE family efflux transporter [Dehalococcoidia bacterium]|nr:MATE family efflux transporter [Dehalococcoidia bacterium]
MTSEGIPLGAEEAIGIDLREERLTGTILRLSAPLVAERLSTTAIGIVDAVLVGRYVGSDGVAAIGIAGLLLWLPLSGAWGVNVGSTIVVAHSAGARALDDLQRSVRASLTFAFLWGLAVSLFLVVAAHQLMQLMAAREGVLGPGVDYMRVTSLGMPFMVLMFAANGCLRGVGDTRTPMLVIMVSNVVNGVVAFLLISGVFGLPKLGAAAAGAGIASAGVAGALIAVGVLVRGDGPILFRPLQALHFGRDEARRLLNIAIPVGLEELQFNLAFLVYSRLITDFGTAAAAAHAIALRALDIAQVPGFALGTAGTAVVGQSLGAGRPDLAERTGKETRKWALITMVGLGVLVLLFAPQMVGLFVNDPEVIDIGSRCLRVFALAFPMMGMGMALSGTLRGAGDVRYVLGVLTFTAWTVRIPAAFIFSHVVGWGPAGAWAGAVLEQNVRAGLIWLRFAGGRWKTKRV